MKAPSDLDIQTHRLCSQGALEICPSSTDPKFLELRTPWFHLGQLSSPTATMAGSQNLDAFFKSHLQM